MNILSIGEKEKKAPKILAVASGKGGVGKSTFTVNCALAFQSKGYKVGILDADVYGPSLRALLPEEQLPFEKNGRIQPAYSHSIAYVSLALFRSEEKAASVRAPIANKMIQQFLEQVDWGDLDYLFIDFPPGTGDIQITLAQKAAIAGAIAITTPQKLACLDVKKALNLFESLQVPIIGIVENMSFYTVGNERFHPFGSGGAKELAELYGYPLLGALPLSPLLNSLQDEGKNLFHHKEKGEEVELFVHLSERIEEELSLLQSAARSPFILEWRKM